MSTGFSTNQIEQLLISTRRNNGILKNVDLSLCTINCLLEDKPNENGVISYINKLLKLSRNDEEVYMCLNNIISCVSKNTLSENILFWIEKIAEAPNSEICPKRYIVISKLIQFGQDNQDFNKLMLSSLLFKLIDECLSVDAVSLHANNSLGCLSICLETYPSTSGSMKNKIESYLMQFLFLKTTNFKLLKNAALCFQRLQKVGSAGPEGINYKNNWKTAFEKLCITFDTLYDSFFEDVEEFYDYEKSSIDPYTIPDLPKVISSTEVLYITVNRLENLCLFLRGMLENKFDHPKSIRPQYVIDIISRVLSLHICMNSKTNSNMFHFGILLLQHQVSVLYLLRSIIAVLELNLLQFSVKISKLLTDCLGRVQNCNCFNYAREYKQALYKVLEYWIKTLRNCLNRNIHDKLINLMIDDISPISSDVSLHISSVNESGKMKKKAMHAKIIASSIKPAEIDISTNHFLNTKEKICYQALCCLSTLLNNVHLSVKDTTLLKLHNTLTDVTLSIYTGKKLVPYNTENIKVKLYEALVATIECSRPPSINLIVNLLKEGSRNHNAAISLTCNRGLSLLEKVCQPVCPSWNLNYQNRLTSNLNNEMMNFLEEEALPMSNNYIDEEEIIAEPTETLPEKSTKQSNSDVTIQCISREDRDTQPVSDIKIQDAQMITVERIDSESLQNESEPKQVNESSDKSHLKEVDSISNESHPVYGDSTPNKSQQQEDLDLNNKITIDEQNTNSNLADDCGEPAQKKIKKDTTTDLDINVMLAAFVDEVSDDIN